jgi:hypothetical protein
MLVGVISPRERLWRTPSPSISVYNRSAFVGQYLLAPADRLSANCRGCVKTAPVTNRSRPPGQLANMMHEAAPIGEERVQGDPCGPGGPPYFAGAGSRSGRFLRRPVRIDNKLLGGAFVEVLIPLRSVIQRNDGRIACLGGMNLVVQDGHHQLAVVT